MSSCWPFPDIECFQKLPNCKLYLNFYLFLAINKTTLRLSSTDIASDAIEGVINPRTDVFQHITEAHFIDGSGFRGTFGVFLGLLKNLPNLEILHIDSQDRNINVLLEEFLPHMPRLKEIYLKGSNVRINERFIILKKYASCLKKLTIAGQYNNEAKDIFRDTFVNICNF